uniref:ZSWIM1/3 RNaseH-like domain-containing protein n=1 Tax=Trichobilharzia regenti TaxID=157069 RepID=A0AA85J231_TRIRE|nr:unnamed protein product [Trichobilharzia regenti]
MIDVEFGKLMTYDDYRNFREQVYPNIDTLIGEIRDTGSVWCVLDSRRRVEKFSFATREMISLYKKFPEVVGMDSTYKTNREGHPLYQLVVTDGMNRSCPLMYSTTHRERLVDVEAVLQSFKNIMGDTSQTVTFVIDNSAAEQRAIRDEFPACSIILCAFHVIRAFNNKFRDPNCKKMFKEMVYTTSNGR